MQLKNDCKSCGHLKTCLPGKLNIKDLSHFEDIIYRQYTLKKNQPLYHKSDLFKSVYLIKSGSIKTYQVDNFGKTNKMRFHFPSDLIGLCGIHDNQYTYNAVALENSLICEIQFEDLLNLSTQFSELLNQLMVTLSEAFTSNYQFCLNSSAQQRFSSFLLHLVNKTHYTNLPSFHCQLSMTKKDIGHHLGLSIETICRLFSKFQKAKIIACKQKTIMLLELNIINEIAMGIHQDIHRYFL